MFLSSQLTNPILSINRVRIHQVLLLLHPHSEVSVLWGVEGGVKDVFRFLGFQFFREENVYLGNIYARLPRGIFRCGYLLRILRGSLHS